VGGAARRREPVAAGGRKGNRWARHRMGEREKLLGTIAQRRFQRHGRAAGGPQVDLVRYSCSQSHMPPQTAPERTGS
jgi:hypothetical protein